MNAIEHLEKEHEKLKQVMKNLESCLNGEMNKDKADEYFQQFKKLYQSHTQLEEDIIYPEFEKHTELNKLALKGYQAHHVVDVGLLELRLLPYSSASWGPKFAVIKDSILAHIKEEEQKLFEQAKVTLTPKEMARLGDKMAAREKKDS